jgi:excisionase family DNA binding protein
VTDYIKLPEVAHRLGVSEKTARRMVKAGKLPAVFIGNAYRVTEDDLATYLESAKVEPGKALAPPSQDTLFNGVSEEERRALDRIEEFCDQLEAAASEGKLDEPIVATAFQARVVDLGSMMPALYEHESMRPAMRPLAIRFLELARLLESDAETNNVINFATERLERRAS